MKLGCRTSTAWRSGSPASLLGSSFRKASKSCGSKTLVVANCQTIGPSLGPSSARPLAMNRAIASPASPSTRRLVTYCDPLTLKTKPGGVASRHLAKLDGFCNR